ncbi:MAG: hypothetical protein M3Y59_10005 [Myxococcota bacterium]|nr:hypothetical protein [Myxococcota bacterium]
MPGSFAEAEELVHDSLERAWKPSPSSSGCGSRVEGSRR